MASVSFDSLVYVAVLTVLFITFLCYYFCVLVPYKNFPSHRLELKILYWIITRKPLNSILFQHLIKVLKRHENEGMCTVWFLKPYIFIYGEETTKLLVNDPATIDKPSIYKNFDFCLKDALFTCNGQKWRRMRMLISPAFQVSVIRDNIDVYNEYSAKLVQDLKTASPREVTKCLKKCSTHAFVETIYGLRGDNPENEFKINRMIEVIEKIGKFAIRRLVTPWLYFDFTLHIFPSGRKSLELYDEVHDRTKKESFRLYPTIPFYARHLEKEMQYGQYRFPENSTLIFVPYMLHRQPDIYPDPERFDPDRFMEPNSKINANNYTPFAEGARSCPGKNFAGMTMKVILCHLLRNFRIISLDRREDIEISWGIVLSSSQNLRMKFEPRTSATDNK